ncbi:hypothetical protein [Pseudoduganella sp. OTU4001]|uniref:hypothetical protein n=1 Tax=Pseudoduganella sp. OTU4001 TaxID=3043854 RepID=UPI00313AB33F
MGITTRLRANVRAARELWQRLRQRHASTPTAARRLLAAVALRAYRRLAYAVNDGFLMRRASAPRFAAFQAGIAERLGGHFYVIVMPDTLHFLLPCLRLVAGRLPIVLLLNGARAWEAALLRQHFPDLPQFRVATLPRSSVNHGAMIDMMLRHNAHDFGILDHDLYLFDQRVLQELRFSDAEFLLCLLADSGPRWTYPLTHFLYFRAAAWQRLMRQYGVGAGIYRKVPAAARGQLRGAGLRDGETLKPYHDFYDTLHVLLALGYSEGMELVQFEFADGGVIHLGGTSIGSHHTKGMMDLYIHLLFLELAQVPELERRYAHLAAPFNNAGALRARLPQTPEVRRQLDLLDRLAGQLNGQALASRTGCSSASNCSTGSGGPNR